MKTRIYTFPALILLAGMFFSQNVHATIHQVNVSNYVFSPANINVTVGDTIKWVWVSGVHTTTSTTVPATATAWDQPITSSSTTYSYQVTVAGVYDYQCTYHAAMGMVGSFTASNPANTLSVSPSNQNVSSSAGSTSFSVTSNTSWNASSNAAWCSPTLSGSGNGTITATYDQNGTNFVRVATITVTASGVTPQMVTVTQAASTLGVNDPATVTYSFYPNPVKSKLNISAESLKTSAVVINLYNINGMRVLGPLTLEGSPASVDISTLPDGVYFIRIGENNSGIVKRIIKSF